MIQLLAVAPQIRKTLDDLVISDDALIVVTESIEKPGNLGTILRSSDAAGVDAVIVCDRCTDINNPNVVRASIGTLFSAVVQLSRTRGSLLSIIVLAILMPLMIPATFTLLVIFGAINPEVTGTGTLGFVGSFDAAVGYMVSFDAIFVVASWLLFGFIIKE